MHSYVPGSSHRWATHYLHVILGDIGLFYVGVGGDILGLTDVERLISCTQFQHASVSLLNIYSYTFILVPYSLSPIFSTEFLTSSATYLLSKGSPVPGRTAH